MQPVDLRYVAGEVGPGPHLRDVPRQIRQAARLGAHQLVLAEQPLRQVARVRVRVDRDGRGAAQLREDQPHPDRGRGLADPALEGQEHGAVGALQRTGDPRAALSETHLRLAGPKIHPARRQPVHRPTNPALGHRLRRPHEQRRRWRWLQLGRRRCRWNVHVHRDRPQGHVRRHRPRGRLVRRCPRRRSRRDRRRRRVRRHRGSGGLLGFGGPRPRRGHLLARFGGLWLWFHEGPGGRWFDGLALRFLDHRLRGRAARPRRGPVGWRGLAVGRGHGCGRCGEGLPVGVHGEPGHPAALGLVHAAGQHRTPRLARHGRQVLEH